MALGPEQDLPYSTSFCDTEQYVSSLLSFARSSDLLKTLCGGVHILDFFASDPDLYTQILSADWRAFIQAHSITEFLDLLLREPLDQFQHEELRDDWRSGPSPPESLVSYVAEVRRHLLSHRPVSSQCSRNRAMKPVHKMARRVAVGMNVKKVHEVGLFASYIDQLTSTLSTADSTQITRLIDFGSGQNYLGRALASLPYSRNIIAIETKGHNQERAKRMDQTARLSSRERYRYEKRPSAESVKIANKQAPAMRYNSNDRVITKIEPAAEGVGQIQYVEHYIEDGDLQHVLKQIDDSTFEQDSNKDKMERRAPMRKPDKKFLVMSLHSCGNLVHHGLRSLVKNESVKAVAMVGCCYNLVTERLTPATYKLPGLRPKGHTNGDHESVACDIHGFPMSDRICRVASDGMRLNITARMMAVQAPSNWTDKDSDGFFTRHFYRALLQRILLDKGVVEPPTTACVGGAPLDHSSGTPIIIGSLRKSYYTSFTSYVRGALTKLSQDPGRGLLFKTMLEELSDADIELYELKYGPRKKDLSAVWSLMAFSAGVVEALIVVDRYLWLKEQDQVDRAWVEPIFDYAISPRNLVVVGIKK